LEAEKYRRSYGRGVGEKSEKQKFPEDKRQIYPRCPPRPEGPHTGVFRNRTTSAVERKACWQMLLPPASFNAKVVPGAGNEALARRGEKTESRGKNKEKFHKANFFNT